MGFASGHFKYSSAKAKAWRPFCGAHGGPALLPPPGVWSRPN